MDKIFVMEVEYQSQPVYELTLSGKLKNKYTISVKLFVLAATQQGALELGYSFLKKEYPDLQPKGIKAAWAVEELILPI